MNDPNPTAALEVEGSPLRTTVFSKAKSKWREISKEQWTVAGQLFAAVTVLYVFLGLLFAGLLVATIEIRQEEWIELPHDFFGDFSKVERPLVDLDGTELIREGVTGEEGSEIRRFFNRPDGCEVASNGRNLVCVDDGDDGRWVLYPWVQANADRLESVMSCSEQTTTLLSSDGTIGDGMGGLVEGVCVNFIPLRDVEELVGSQ